MIKTSSLAVLVLLASSLAVGAQDRRCGTVRRMDVIPPASAMPTDCGYWTNVPEPEYHPDAGCLYEIQIVFHVLQHTNGDGFVDAATLQDQVDVLSEDFQALAGTPGELGNNAKIRFRLATLDPDGNPTTGITYTMNDRWFDDQGNYGDTLTWDSNRYLNIYTNDAPGFYGYVNGFASEGGLVGTQDDYVVINYKTIGREPTAWWDGNMGRTGTHEIGHYVGLYHTFDSGCGDAMDCYGTSDLICDTNPQAGATDWCDVPSESCGSLDPIENYMDYTADVCLTEFTPEQVLRARCTLEHWRPDVWTAICNESNCSDGIDDDGDDGVDCEDLDCFDDPACNEAACDFDGDGMPDGLDLCCANGDDDDGDGDVDCEDADCADAAPCNPASEDCSNGMDDDADGLVDCEDPECAATPVCSEAACDLDGDGIPDGLDACCGNGDDDDGDGDVDCEDAECAEAAPCIPVIEDCSNGLDDDGDGLVDCEDPDCLSDDMADCDGDGTVNGEDCQPANPLVGGPPDEVARLDVANPGNGDAELTWSSVPGALDFDVVSGLLGELWAGGTGIDTGACAPGGNDVTPPYTDTRRPPAAADDGHWYVVRAQNPCPGSYGSDSRLVERPLPTLRGSP